MAAAWQQAASAGIEQAARNTQGDFAVGLLDGAGNPMLAVDRFAMQTMCWRLENGQVRFAERADELAGPDPKLDPQAIYDYLFFHAIPSPRTIFKDVQRLPPGHCLSVQAGKPVAKPYWQTQFDEALRPHFDSLRDEFRGHLQAAVAAQLDGGKPGCFLSGGTDSSTIAGMIGLAAGRPAATYSIGFEAEGYDEMEIARLAARHFGTEHHEYYVTPADLVASIPAVAASYDQPFGNSSALPAYYCAMMARDDGVTRILAGDGGDELFGGNLRYAKQRVFDLYAHLPAALRSAVLEPWLGAPGERPTALLRKAASYVDQARRPMPGRMDVYNLLERLGVQTVLTPGFLSQVDRSGPGQQQQAVWDSATAASSVNRHLAFDWRYTLAETDLPKVRGTTALAGIAVGFPMLEQAVVDFSMRLPTGYKLKGQQLRWFFKEALRGFLPDAILTKKKQGFGLPFGVWATRDAALKALATDSLHTLADRGIVQRSFITRLVDEHLPAHPGYY
ncbi:MAG: asparagine synthase C-terminal domain-containing protein, partial [Rubrivivax sp.]|nr:asparagine synthase C-terminal domain-containing protein [Rubrivivax sp.]